MVVSAALFTGCATTRTQATNRLLISDALEQIDLTQLPPREFSCPDGNKVSAPPETTPPPQKQKQPPDNSKTKP